MIFSYLSGLPKIYRIPLIVVGVTAIGVVAVSVFGYVVMWLWNRVLTGVVDVPAITFWQALGLFLLAKLFFGFGGGASPRGIRTRMVRDRGREDKCQPVGIDDQDQELAARLENTRHFR